MSENTERPDEWAALVLSNIDRLSAQVAAVTSEMVRVQVRLEGFQFARLMHDLEDVAGKLSELDTKLILLDDKLSGETGLIKKSQDLENRVRILEAGQNNNAGRNLILAALITMILSAIISTTVSTLIEKQERTEKPTPDQGK